MDESLDRVINLDGKVRVAADPRHIPPIIPKNTLEPKVARNLEGADSAV
jgi:hypothetical protein